MATKVLNYYQILEINKNATLDEIKKAYKKLALQWHPDRQISKSLAEQEKANEKMQQINSAHEVLSDPEKRKQFDLLINNRDISIKVLVTVGALILTVYLFSGEEN